MALPWVEALRQSPGKKLEGFWVVDGLPFPQNVTIELQFLSLYDAEDIEAKVPFVFISPVLIPEFARPIFNEAEEILQEGEFKDKKYYTCSPAHSRSQDSIRWNPKDFPDTSDKLRAGFSPKLSWETRYKTEDLEVSFRDELTKIEWLKLGRLLMGHLIRKELEFWSSGMTYIIPMYIAFCVVLDQGDDPLQSVSGTTDFVFLGLDYVGENQN